MSFAVDHAPPFLTFTIDRPQALNAIDFDVMEGLEDALDVVEKDPRFRAFILTGRGRRAFISGGDLRKFATLHTREQVGMMALRMRVILERFEALNAWTFAAVNGPAFGGGCETALACDFRIAAENATFGFTQANFAVPPGWGGLTRLVETVGRPTALHWLADGAIVDAATAVQAKLVHQVVPFEKLEASVRAFSARFIQHDRRLIGALKAGMRNAQNLPRRASIEGELESFVECWLSEEHQRRIDAFLDRTRE